MGLVNAHSQSEAVELILPLLSDEEAAIFKRGRNTNANVPKSSSPVDYRRATGLEALFGFLYIKNRLERIHILFDIIWDGERAGDDDGAEDKKQQSV